MKEALLKTDNDTKQLILEVSALSGYSQNVVKEVLEYLLVSWAICVVDKPDDFAELKIPYLGSVKVKYKKDIINKEGELETEVDSFVDLSDYFKKLVGDLYSEGISDIVPLLSKKIEQAVLVASAKV